MAVERTEIGYLPGRALIRGLWWLRRRLAAGPRRRRSLYREIARERERLRKIERNLPPNAARSASRAGGWVLHWDAFAQPLTERSGMDVLSGAEICHGLNLYHDAEAAQICWAQEVDVSRPPSLRITCYRFDGRFLSLALAVPQKRSTAIGRRHEVVVDLAARVSRPLALHVRLNLSIAQRSQELHAHRILTDAPQQVVFDLGGLSWEADTGAKMWLDVIVSNPAMAEITFDDIVLTLRPRAGDA